MTSLPSHSTPASETTFDDTARAAIGQQMSENASLNHADSPGAVGANPYEQSDRVPNVVHGATLEVACHAGGRGFESRRSRLYLQGFARADDMPRFRIPR
jgi:hypothetical protein